MMEGPWENIKIASLHSFASFKANSFIFISYCSCCTLHEEKGGLLMSRKSLGLFNVFWGRIHQMVIIHQLQNFQIRVYRKSFKQNGILGCLY
jgi:hypothetical protein